VSLPSCAAAAAFTCPTPTFQQLGIHSPIFPAGLSPHLGITSPAGPGKWHDMSGMSLVDPDAWFAGENMGSMTDIFKNDHISIFTSTDQDDPAGEW
jgi:hypothetical protein